MNDKKTRKIFIIGIARSGTSLMQQLIASHSEIIGVNETEILKKFKSNIEINDFLKEICKSKKEFKITKSYLNMIFENNLTGTNAFFFLDKFCEAHKKYFNKSCYVEKSPIHSFFIKEILSNFPNSKLIIILRNPGAIVASRLFARKTCRGKKYGFSRKIRFLLNLSEIIFTYKEFSKWYKKNNNRILFVKYKDLVKKPNEKLRDIFNFLNLSYENVGEDIKPLDMRMKAKNINKIMNSSFRDLRKEQRKISDGSLDKWKDILTNSEIDFIKKYFSLENLSLINKFYPSLCFNVRKKFNLSLRLFKFFSQIDYLFFLGKNIPEKLQNKLFLI